LSGEEVAKDDDMKRILKALVEGSLNYTALLEKTNLEKDTLIRKSKKLMDSGHLNIETLTDRSRSYSLTSAGSKLVNDLELLANAVSSTSIQDDEALAETVIRHFKKSEWKPIMSEMILGTEKILYMSTIGSKSLENEDYRKFTDVAFPDLIDKGVTIRMISAHGYMSNKVLKRLKKYGVQVKFTKFQNLQKMSGRYNPKHPFVKNLCHITVSDRKHWIYTETVGDQNTREGFQCRNDPNNADILSEILFTLWDSGDEKQNDKLRLDN